ncbi:MAG: hypothetical protein II059_04245 [Clostridia bacterium]|nr:hypothetical protein [Clostridia bacterium]
MGAVYAALSDVILFSANLTAHEQEQAESLIDTACAKLRLTAKRYGKDLDAMIEADEDLETAVKSVIVTSVKRALQTYSDGDLTAAQTSQSGMGYAVSMTYLNAGQSLYFLRSELKDLGIVRQRYGAMEVYKFETNAQGN